MAYSEKVAGRYNAIGRVRLSVRLLPLQLLSQLTFELSDILHVHWP